MENLKNITIKGSIIVNITLFVILFTPVSEWLHELIMIDMKVPKYSSVTVICSSNFPYPTQNGFPGLSTLARIEKGVRIYKAGKTKKLIAFGGISMGPNGKTTGQAIKERLLLYGIPEKDIIVQDAVKGKIPYYENILHMIYHHKEIDFQKSIFISSIDQSFRLFHALKSEIKNPVVVTGEHYELYPDWGKRFQIFRRIANELIVAIPRFWITNRFSNPSKFKWVVGNPNLKNN